MPWPWISPQRWPHCHKAPRSCRWGLGKQQGKKYEKKLGQQKQMHSTQKKEGRLNTDSFSPPKDVTWNFSRKSMGNCRSLWKPSFGAWSGVPAVECWSSRWSMLGPSASSVLPGSSGSRWKRLSEQTWLQLRKKKKKNNKSIFFEWTQLWMSFLFRFLDSGGNKNSHPPSYCSGPGHHCDLLLAVGSGLLLLLEQAQPAQPVGAVVFCCWLLQVDSTWHIFFSCVFLLHVWEKEFGISLNWESFFPKASPMLGFSFSLLDGSRRGGGARSDGTLVWTGCMMMERDGCDTGWMWYRMGVIRDGCEIRDRCAKRDGCDTGWVWYGTGVDGCCSGMDGRERDWDWVWTGVDGGCGWNREGKMEGSETDVDGGVDGWVWTGVDGCGRGCGWKMEGSETGCGAVWTGVWMEQGWEDGGVGVGGGADGGEREWVRTGVDGDCVWCDGSESGGERDWVWTGVDGGADGAWKEMGGSEALCGLVWMEVWVADGGGETGSGWLWTAVWVECFVVGWNIQEIEVEGLLVEMIVGERGAGVGGQRSCTKRVSGLVSNMLRCGLKYSKNWGWRGCRWRWS